MRVVGLSGAQGAGKSTLLKELVARGWTVDSFRVSRAVQRELGWDSLENVMESAQTMTLFQTTVLEQKYANDFMLKGLPSARTMDPQGDIILTERTFADIYAYTAQWTWRLVDQGKFTFGEALKFMKDFTDRCAAGQKTCYTGAVLLPFMEHVVWEDDPNRAAFKDVETVYEDIDRFVERMLPLNYPKHVVRGKTVAERADEVESFLRTL